MDAVQVHGTFVLEMKRDLKYNFGYRMIKLRFQLETRKRKEF